MVVRADTRYRELSGWDREPGARGPKVWGVPLDGTLPWPETVALARVLATFTSTPKQAYFCLWDGHGDPETRALAGRPWRVRMEHRAYHLLIGPVAAAADLASERSYRGAGLWWPRDRAWLVATEIDGFNTFVGASPDAVAALVADPALEVVPADPDTPLDSSPWPPA